MNTIEFVIIGIFMSYQIYLLISTWIEIYSFKRMFKPSLIIKKGKIAKHYIEKSILDSPEKLIEKISFEDNLEEDESYLDVAITETKSKNKTLNRIRNSLNNYLVKNIGADVNFEIIKDIIDREIDAEDEGINQSLHSPLYVGLAATMIGIIIGLFGMNSIDSKESFDVSPIIDGVKIAMTASLLGLIFTTVLSSVLYKRARTVILTGKNTLISDMQTYLLPILISEVDMGIQGLKKSINEFNKNATFIVNAAKEVSQSTSINIIEQNKLFDKIEQMDVKKMARYNKDVFKLMEKNLASFEDMTMFFSDLGQISINLKNFSERTSDINNISEKIMENVDNSNALMQFITEHFKKIEELGNLSQHAVAQADVNFKNAIDQLSLEINNRINELNNKGAEFDSEFREIIDIIKEQLREMADKHIQEFTDAYRNAVPKFDKLNHLSNLPLIKDEIKSEATIVEKISDINNKNTSTLDNILEHEKKLFYAIGNLSNKIESFSKKYVQPQHPNKINDSVKDNHKKSLVDIIKTSVQIFFYGAASGLLIYFIYYLLQ